MSPCLRSVPSWGCPWTWSSLRAASFLSLFSFLSRRGRNPSFVLPGAVMLLFLSRSCFVGSGQVHLPCDVSPCRAVADGLSKTAPEMPEGSLRVRPPPRKRDSGRRRRAGGASRDGRTRRRAALWLRAGRLSPAVLATRPRQGRSRSPNMGSTKRFRLRPAPPSRSRSIRCCPAGRQV